MRRIVDPVPRVLAVVLEPLVALIVIADPRDLPIESRSRLIVGQVSIRVRAWSEEKS